MIQLRMKGASAPAVREAAREILPLAEAAGVILVINDHPEVARDVGAPFCHLGQEDFFDAGYTHADQISRPPGKLGVGISSHGPAQAERALNAGAAYLGVGPVYPTPTKPEATPATLTYVRWAATHVRIPWFAIGGINLGNLDQVLAAGAHRICVVSAILNAPSIPEACQAFKQRLALVSNSSIDSTS